MKTIATILTVLFICAGCHKEEASTNHAQSESSTSRECDECVSPIECEMTNMPQKLAGKGRNSMYWGVDLAKSIMAINDRNERSRLMNKYLDSMLLLEPSLNVCQNVPRAFRNYELLIDASTIFEDDAEVAERILGIMCKCIRLHRQEIKKWADAIMREPNHRARVDMKNIHGCLSTDFMMFTNRVERTYFPWMKSHGLSTGRHEHWRREINAAYEWEQRMKKHTASIRSAEGEPVALNTENGRKNDTRDHFGVSLRTME